MHDESDELPSAELRAFVYSCIDSVEQVHILALLGSGEQAWTARRVAEQVALADTVVRHHLETLAARGLLSIAVETELSYRYAPKSDMLRRCGDQLIAGYERAPMSILRLVATSLGPSVKRIADAFRLRERK